MIKQIIEFKVHGDQLEMLTPFKTFAANTVNYIEARFIDLENDSAWSGYDEILAVWYTDLKQKESEIINGVTIIPAELLTRPGTLAMNLCANKRDGNILIARNTSYPLEVLELTRTNL